MAKPSIGTPTFVSLATPTTRRNPWPILALLALNGLAAAGLWQAMERPIDTAPIKATSANATVERSSSAGPDTLIPGARSLADLPETARRPLFSASRRPWVETPKPPEPVTNVATPPPVVVPAYPANQLQLIGVQGHRNNAARALIRVGSESQGTWLRVGESIRGWKLREVTSDSSVILETRGEQVELVTDDAGAPVNQAQQPPQQLRR